METQAIENEPIRKPRLLKRVREAVKFERDTLMMIVLLFVFSASMGVVWFLNSGGKEAATAGGTEEAAIVTETKPSLPKSNRTYQVVQKDMDISIVANGVVKATKLTSVVAPVGGRVQELPVGVNATITPETIIVKLDKSAAQALVDRAKADYDLRVAQLDQQKAAVKPLAANIRVSELSADIAKKAWDDATADLDKTDIKSPLTGKLGLLLVWPGQSVGANQELARLYEPKDLVIEVWVESNVAFTLRQDATATVTFASQAGQKLQARMKSMGSSVEGNTSGPQVPLLLSIVNVENLSWVHDRLHGALVEMPGVKKVISVPKAAIFNKGGKDMVYAIKDGKLEAKEVTKGLTNAEEVEILEGLEGNEILALSDAL